VQLRATCVQKFAKFSVQQQQLHGSTLNSARVHHVPL
jgi:hypothetical protein